MSKLIWKVLSRGQRSCQYLPLRPLSTLSPPLHAENKLTREEMEEHRKKVMGKNLPKRRPLEGVKKVVLVASGKGGVGKSTIATNLAVGLKTIFPQRDVGLLDADVFGPSLPIMMNLPSVKPDLDVTGKLMIPPEKYGVKCMSMGFLVKPDSPVIWRGLMVMSAIERLLRGVQWSPLDILVVDMPPGTGDTQLSFAQSVVVDGALMVTTPQKVALQDAMKGAEMFKKTGVPLLGFILNMASYSCTSCGSSNSVGNLPALKTSIEAYGSSIIGEIPFQIGISDASDEGIPYVISNESCDQAKEFQRISRAIYKQLNL